MRCLIICLWLAHRAHAATCPPPPIPRVAEGDARFDAVRTREVLERLAAGTLEEPSDDARLVSHDAATLWTRRWQLECAARAGHVANPDAIVREIAGEAAALLDPARRPPPPAQLDWRPSEGVHPAVPREIPNPRSYRIAGGVLVGAGAAFLACGIAFGVEAARVDPKALFGDLFQGVAAMGAAFCGTDGVAAVVAGGVLLQRGARYDRERRVQPTANGLRITF